MNTKDFAEKILGNMSEDNAAFADILDQIIAFIEKLLPLFTNCTGARLKSRVATGEGNTRRARRVRRRQENWLHRKASRSFSDYEMDQFGDDLVDGTLQSVSESDSGSLDQLLSD